MHSARVPQIVGRLSVGPARPLEVGCCTGTGRPGQGAAIEETKDFRDHRMADCMTQPGQLRSEVACRFRGPPQRRFGVASCLRFNQSVQRIQQFRINDFGFLRPPPGARTRSEDHPAGVAASSVMPRRIVVRDALVASCMALIPPRPHDFASVASARRRSRSFKRGSRSTKRASIARNRSSSLIAMRQFTRPRISIGATCGAARDSPNWITYFIAVT